MDKNNLSTMTLAELRIKKGITQKEFATRLGIATSTYNMYENGVRNVPIDVVNLISKILDVKVEDIFLPVSFTISKSKKMV